jgi:hypothetical protein
VSSTSSQRFELRLEAFNVFDQLLLGMPNADRNTATFGSITTASAPRVVQIAVRFDF